MDNTLIEDFHISEIHVGVCHMVNFPFLITTPGNQVAQLRGGYWPIMELVYTDGRFLYWASMQ